MSSITMPGLLEQKLPKQPCFFSSIFIRIKISRIYSLIRLYAVELFPITVG